MKSPESVDDFREALPVRGPESTHPRAVGSPLPRGLSRRQAHSSGEGERQLALPAGRNLSSPESGSESESPSTSSLLRAVAAVRSALPFVQRILPLLDGNLAAAIVNVLAPHPQKAAPVPPVNLAPIEESVAALEMQQRALHDQVAEQNSSLKRVEDQLEAVREATDRNTLEQQELMEDLKAVGNKANLVALVALALLLISIFLNFVLYRHIQQVLP